VLRDPEGQFRRDYNRRSFAFSHELRGNPLFELPHLIEYSRRLAPNPELAYWSNGAVSVSDRWDTPGGRRLSLQDTIANIGDNNSLVILKRIELDAAFGPFMREIMAQVIDLVGPAMRDDVLIGRGTLLVASPRRITAYHLDADTNFLLQIWGDKSLSVFNQTDRTLVSDQELESYYAGDINGAAFRQSRQHDGKTYELLAGQGIHIPSMAPHWAQNGRQISIALSINFDLRSIARLARIYKLNHRLRRFGLKPTPPGVSMWRDRVKLAGAYGLAATRDLLRK
jgi:hypothetical protein